MCGIVRCKLGPASFAAGMSEPSLSPMAPAGFDGRLRPPGEVGKKLCTSTPILEVKIPARCRGTGMQAALPGANSDRHEAEHERDPTSSLPALDAHDTRMQVIGEMGDLRAS
jgi:hypothetical protein